MLKFTIKITEKDDKDTKVELVAPKKAELDKAKQSEKVALNLIYGKISSTLQKMSEE